jgi:hypothetical protein
LECFIIEITKYNLVSFQKDFKISFLFRKRDFQFEIKDDQQFLQLILLCVTNREDSLVSRILSQKLEISPNFSFEKRSKYTRETLLSTLVTNRDFALCPKNSGIIHFVISCSSIETICDSISHLLEFSNFEQISRYFSSFSLPKKIKIDKISYQNLCSYLDLTSPLRSSFKISF